MNIKERNERLYQCLDAMRFGKVDHSKDMNPIEQFNPFKFDWNLMVKPPITSLIHPKVIDDLTNLVSDARLMNNPSKKFKYVNQLLATMGFRPAASGTNRRAFYCDYDPSIILKLGSDRVGRNDNLSEMYTQQILKPFCTKIYDVLPTGVLSLCERVEPMTEKDFKTRWSSEIFDLIMNLMYRGYILEDVGGNFYKNWAIRLGFGPVIIDFPYVYEIDWSKLKCVYVNPITKERCTGELDYDYSKGMSEIICTKCGSRYSGAYLAKSGMISTEIRKGNTKMKNQIQVELRRGKNVVYRNYAERTPDQIPFVLAEPPKPAVQQAQQVQIVDNSWQDNVPTLEEIPQFLVDVFNNSNINNQVTNPAVQKHEQQHVAQAQQVVVQQKQEEPKKREINVDIEFGRQKKIERFGFGASTVRKPKAKTNDPNNSRFKKTPIREELLPIVTEFLDKIYSEFGRGAAIDTSKRLGIYWIDPKDRGDNKLLNPFNSGMTTKPTSEVVKTLETSIKNKDTEKIQQIIGDAIRSAAPQFKGVEENEKVQPVQTQSAATTIGSTSENAYGKENSITRTSENKESKESSTDATTGKQTQGLFPVKPISAEEQEKLDLESRNEPAVMGYPGEPLVVTMRNEQKIPILKDKLLNELSGFDAFEESADNIEYLKESAIECVGNDVANLYNTELGAVEILVNEDIDFTNRKRYIVAVECNKTPVFSISAYPKNDNAESVQLAGREIAAGINLLDTEVNPAQQTAVLEEDAEYTMSPEEEKRHLENDIAELLHEKMLENLEEMKKQPTPIHEKSFMVTKLASALHEGGMHVAESNNRSYEYVEKNYPFVEGEL